eukprot:UN1798
MVKTRPAKERKRPLKRNCRWTLLTQLDLVSQELVMEEEDNSQGTRVLTAYYQGTRVIEDKTAIFFHNFVYFFLSLLSYLQLRTTAAM